MNLGPCLVILCFFSHTFSNSDQVSENSGELLLEFTENQAPYFTKNNATIFMTIKSFSLTNSTWSHLKIDSLKANGSSLSQIYLLVCSSKPAEELTEFSSLSNFIQTSCNLVIPMTYPMNNVSYIGCFNIDHSVSYLILLSVSESIQQALHHRVHLTASNQTCGQPLKSVIKTRNPESNSYFDCTFVPKSPLVQSVFLHYSGAIELVKSSRKIMMWIGSNNTLSFIAGSQSSCVSIDRNVTANAILVRHLLTTKSETLSDPLIVFLTYSGSGDLVKNALPSPLQPSISPDNPHICLSEENSIPVDDMEVGAIKTIGSSIPKISIMACHYDATTSDCYANLLPIFPDSLITLPPNSSYFLGPSAQRDILAIKFLEKNRKPFCLDLEVETNSKKKVDVMLFAAPGGTVPPQAYHKIDLSCPYNYKEPITAIMYRTHTHGFGRYVAMWVENGDKWDLLAAENKTDVILPLSKHFQIQNHDQLNVRCSYDTHAYNEPSPIDLSGEMCNFYLYYTINSSYKQPIKDCLIQKLFDPPRDKREQIYHQLPRRKLTYGTYLQLKKSWSLKTQNSKSNFAISNLGHKDKTLVILEGCSRFVSHDSSWFNEDNTLSNYMNLEKVDSVTLFSTRSDSVIHSGGKNRFYLPTGLHVTSENELYVTDIGLHQVIKYSTLDFDVNDTPEMFLGTAFVPGNDKTHFCKPSSVLTDDNGNIYVGDGYCNSRIAVFSHDGQFVGSYGTHSLVSGLAGTFGEVTDMTLDTTREVILALDNKLLQIQVMDFSGTFYRVIDLSAFKNVLKICYSVDMDAIVILTSYGLDNIIFILDPVTGTELNFITGGTKVFTAVTTIPGNNTLLVGDQYGTIAVYTDTRVGTNEVYKDSKVHEFSIKKEQGGLDNSLSKLTPLIHFLHISGLSEEEAVVKKSQAHLFSWSITGIFSTSATVALVVIVLVVCVMMCCRKKEEKEEYERCLMSESEEEDVLYDNEAL